MKRFALAACFILIFLASASILSAADIAAVPKPSNEMSAVSEILPPVPMPDIHTFISEKPYCLKDGDTGVWYDRVRGCITMSWQNKTRDAFFKAKVTAVTPDTSEVVNYTFSLVAASVCTASYVKGIWDIKKNGVPVCTGCVGEAYGIDSSVGNYFKLYIGDDLCYSENWHLSGYITYRKDF